MDPKGKRNGCSALLMMTAIDAFLMAQCHVMEALFAPEKSFVFVTVKYCIRANRMTLLIKMPKGKRNSCSALGLFTNYVMPLRWVGGQQNITIANFIK